MQNAQNIDGKSIPKSTPFELTGSATDQDGNGLTYNWEEWDLGPQGDLNASSSSAPIFRSYSPSTSPTRIFPKLSDILSNANANNGEVLSTTTRALIFQFIARDDHQVGAYHADMISISVIGSIGPFKILTPNTASTQMGSTTITWDEAGTAAAPVSCGNVDIYLSTNGGQTFPTLLVSNTNNDGSAVVTMPNINTSTARIKVKCSDNVFFDINDANFTITPDSGPSCSITAITVGATSACNAGTNTYTQDLTITYSNPPASGSLMVNGQTFAISSSPQAVTLTGLSADGNVVDAVAKFTDDVACTYTNSSAFTAPVSCGCNISAIAVGATSACNAGTDTYTQDLTITYF